MAGPAGTGQHSGWAPEPRIRFDAIGDAVEVLKRDLGAWVLAVLMAGAIGVLASMCIQYGIMLPLFGANVMMGGGPDAFSPFAFGQIAVSMFASFIGSLPYYILGGGMFRMAVRQVRGERINPMDLFQIGDVWVQLLIAGVLITIASYVGLLLCFFPIFIVYGLTMFTLPLIVDRRMQAVDALTLSVNTLKKDWLMATLFAVVILLIALAGACACGVGLLFTWPIYLLAIAILYRDYFMPETYQGGFGNAATDPSAPTGGMGSYPPAAQPTDPVPPAEPAPTLDPVPPTETTPMDDPVPPEEDPDGRQA
jgi:hypothetical protein